MNSHPAVQKLTDTANASVQTFLSLADIVLNASERLVALNVDAARSAVAFASANATPVASTDLEAQFSSCVAAHGKGIDQAAEYLRNVNEICVQTQADVAELSARHLSEIGESVQSLFDNAPTLSSVGGLDLVSQAKGAAKASKKVA